MSSDKKGSEDTDLEYQYSSEDAGGESSSLETPKKRPILQVLKEKLKERLPKQKKYRVLLFIAVAVYILYKFLNVGTPPLKPSESASQKIEAQRLVEPQNNPSKAAVAEKKLEAAAQKEAAKLAAKPVQAPPPPAALTPAKPVEAPQPAPAPVPVAAAPVVSTTVATTTSTTPSSAQIQELQMSLDRIGRAVSALESSLLTLTTSVVRLSDRVNALSAESKRRNLAIYQPMLPIYFLHSLTNDRAWVNSSGGDFETIKVGDMLPGYGRIQKIDVQKGVISTTSGRTISYGPNDG